MIAIRQSLKPGFSVIELVFYTLIVGVLLAGAFVGLKEALRRAKKSSTASSLRVISQAIDTYYADAQPNRYPESLEDLVNAPEGVRGWDGPYLKTQEINGERQVPKDGWGNDFHYERTPGGVHPYELYSYGAEGEDSPQEKWIDAW